MRSNIGALAKCTWMSRRGMAQLEMMSHPVQVSSVAVKYCTPSSSQRLARKGVRLSIHVFLRPLALKERCQTDAQLGPKTNPGSPEASLLAEVGEAKPDEECGKSSCPLCNQTCPGKTVHLLGGLTPNICHCHSIPMKGNRDAPLVPPNLLLQSRSWGHMFPKGADIVNTASQDILQKGLLVVLEHPGE